jgi:hypothetical protein
MLMTRAWKRGAAGFVADGGLRDGHVLSQLPFPTYASRITITRIHGGEPLWGIYPPSEQTLTDYRASRAANDGGPDVEASTARS